MVPNNYQQYQQPPYYQPKRNNSGNKLLVVLIIFLLTLLVAGGGYYFYSQNKKQQAKIARMQERQREMEERNEALEEKNKNLKEENAKKPKVVEKVVTRRVETEPVTSTTAKTFVVINGVGVRLRFGPGTNYGYLTWANGQTRAPQKGARLEYISETSGWYRVKYLGQEFYVSKDFSYLTYQ